ncbi:MAG TPA: hypothetical protein VEK79_13385 [Thermoanaerobaculia bacterium]|nr:hypothetical protein [Thermoanaerobaculia bacterium]
MSTGGWFTGFTIDAEGNFFFRTDDRIRAIRYGAVLAPPDSTIEASASGSRIRVVVREKDGGPAAGVRVDFHAPEQGASCVLSPAFGITDATGAAAVNCYPTCVGGTYTVTARPLTATSNAAVTLTNPGGPCRRRAVRH